MTSLIFFELYFNPCIKILLSKFPQQSLGGNMFNQSYFKWMHQIVVIF